MTFRKPYTKPTLSSQAFPVAGQRALWLRRWTCKRHSESFYVEVEVLRVGKRVTVSIGLRDGTTRIVVLERRKLFPLGWNQGKPCPT
jgi:hypothetical protein